MGERTGVQWCHHTHNFWIGCEKVSEACKSCYAEVETYPRVQRSRGRELWGANGERHVTSDATWRHPLKWNWDAMGMHERRRVFVNSLSDFFELRLDLVGPRKRAWEIIRFCTGLDFLLLTKRPENIAAMLPVDWGDGWPNVWLGTTVENQKRADERIPELLKVPAAVRFLSVEPLLGAVDLSSWLDPSTCCDDCGTRGTGLGWVIVGGESGRSPRSTDLQWVRTIVRQCCDARVPVFVKQLGAEPTTTAPNPVDDLARINVMKSKKGGEPAEWPVDLRVREFPTARAA